MPSTPFDPKTWLGPSSLLFCAFVLIGLSSCRPPADIPTNQAHESASNAGDYASSQASPELCQRCEGTGSTWCRICYGKGQMYVQESVPYTPEPPMVTGRAQPIPYPQTNWVYKPCDRCQQTGVISCSDCFGDGRQTPEDKFQAERNLAIQKENRKFFDRLYGCMGCPPSKPSSNASAADVVEYASKLEKCRDLGCR